MMEFDQARIESMKPKQLGAAIRSWRETVFRDMKGAEFNKVQSELSLLGALHRAFTTKTGRSYPIEPPRGRVRK